MAKDRKKAIHIHSSIADRQPTPGSLEYGELGVNYNAGNEFISTKNSEDKVVRFSSDEQVVTIMEKKEVIPYSGVVDNIHLDTNRSNIEIKLNQVVAGNTVKHDVVNGAKDIDNQLVNPSDDGGLTNGAGFAIDMSAYALTGGNPTFSSITTSCGASFEGVTDIASGVCGSALNVNVDNVTTSAETVNATVSSANTVVTEANVSAATATISGTSLNVNESTIAISACSGVAITTDNFELKQCNAGGSASFEFCDGYEIKSDDLKLTQCSAGTLTITEDNVSVSGETFVIFENNEIEISSDTLTAATANNMALHSEKKLGLTSKDDMLISSEGDIIATSDTDFCATAGNVATLAGVEQTNIGKNCEDEVITDVVDIEANTLINLSGNTLINNNLTVSGNTTLNNVYLSGNTYFNPSCTSITSSTIEDAICEVLTASSGYNVSLSASTTDPEAGILKKYQILQGGQPVSGGTIDIPKDYLVKSGSVIESGGAKYLDLVLNTKPTVTGTPDEHVYIDVSDLVDNIPECVGELGRSTLSIEYGDVVDKVGDTDTYDPGTPCTGVGQTIKVPTCIENLTNWNGSCYSFTSDVCVSGDVTADAFHQTSDRRKKENIRYMDTESMDKVRNISLKSFNFISDETKRKIYGVIAQDVEDAGLNELVYTDDQGMKSVDYTSFLILRIAQLENMVGRLTYQLAKLEENNKK